MTDVAGKGQAAGPDARPAEKGAGKRRPKRGRRRPDLTARPLTVLDAERWREPQEALRELYLDAESRAIEAYDWYLADRLRRKTLSRRLRGLALVLATGGGLVPLVAVSAGQGISEWGYVLLALAGVCVGFDRFLGLSSGWMRDMVTAQKIQRRLQDFQLDWTMLIAAQARQSDVETQKYLELLRGFVSDLSGLMIEETNEWVAEFRTGLNHLQSQTDDKRA